ERNHDQQHRGENPARLRSRRPSEEYSWKREDSDHAEVEAGENYTLVPQNRDNAEIIVLKRVPEIAELKSEKVNPTAELRRNKVLGLIRPKARHLRMLERTASG